MMKAVEISFGVNVGVIFGRSQWARSCKRTKPLKTPQYGTMFLREFSTQYVHLEDVAPTGGNECVKICL